METRQLSQNSFDDSLILWISQMCDGELSDEHAELLDAALQHDATARRMYLEIVENDALMRRKYAGIASFEYWRAPSVNASIKAPQTSIADEKGQMRSAGRQAAFHRSTWQRRSIVSLMFATASTVLILAVLAIIRTPHEAREKNAPVVQETPAPKTVVGHLTGLSDCTWNGNVQLRRGAPLRAGQTLHLQAGVAEVTFRSGAVVLFEGPASLVIERENAARLRRGRLIARVNRHAVGFTVETPSATVVDLGTEFGVVAQRDGQTEVHVFDGEVELIPVNAESNPRDETPRQRRRLVAGNSLLVSKSDEGSLKFEPIRTRHFVRSLAPPSLNQPTRTDTHVAVLQQGKPLEEGGELYLGTEDTFLPQWQYQNNFGGRRNFDVGSIEPGRSSNALLRFDLSPLAGKFQRIHSVMLRLHVNRSEEASYIWRTGGRIFVHRLTAANADWREGEFETHFKTAENPAAGDSTWLWRRVPNMPWAGSYGANDAGLDYEPTAIAVQAYRPNEQGSLEFAFKGNFAFVSEWAVEAGKNTGFLLRVENPIRHARINFHSSEAENITLRPELVVEYFPVVPLKE